jgi:hypothetical protein
MNIKSSFLSLFALCLSFGLHGQSSPEISEDSLSFREELLLIDSLKNLSEEYIYPFFKNNSVQKGEVLDYKVSFGFFNIGTAQIKSAPNTYKINGRVCYKVDVIGKTSGAVDWVAKISNTWGSYIDTSSFVPHISYRNIKENNYRKVELVKFDHRSDMLELKVLNNKTGEYKEPEYIKTPNNIRDLVSGFTYLRILDFENINFGDTILIDAFFEDTIYDFQTIYMGLETIKTKFGKISCHKLVPIMPNNKLFAGENAVSVWITNDLNKIPIKIEANLVVGKGGCELIGYENLRNQFQAMDEVIE